MKRTVSMHIMVKQKSIKNQKIAIRKYFELKIFRDLKAELRKYIELHFEFQKSTIFNYTFSIIFY